MKYNLYKLAELPDAAVPFNASEGFVRSGELYLPPRIGFSVIVGNIRTSMVTEVIDNYTFKTLNSIYRLVPENQIDKPKPFLSWQYNKSSTERKS